MKPDSQERKMADDRINFDWNDQAGIAVGPQDAIAVYANDNGDLVLRRQKDWNEEEDSVIAVAPAYVRQLIEAMERTLMEIQSK
jgi:thiamine biosynthesis protein ThiC